MKKIQWMAAFLGTALTLPAVSNATPVTYTLYTVASGSLGSWSFFNARLTVTFNADTHGVTTSTDNGVSVLTNTKGVAIVSIVTTDGTAVRATMAAGEIYARYDLSRGLVGFGSNAGIGYPFMVGCYDMIVCSDSQDPYNSDSGSGYPHEDGIVAELAYVAQDAQAGDFVSSSALALPTSLSQSTLLTGYVRSCIEVTVGGGTCTSPGAALHTDRGALKILDSTQIPGSDMSSYNGTGIFTVTVNAGDF